MTLHSDHQTRPADAVLRSITKHCLKDKYGIDTRSYLEIATDLRSFPFQEVVDAVNELRDRKVIAYVQERKCGWRLLDEEESDFRQVKTDSQEAETEDFSDEISRFSLTKKDFQVDFPPKGGGYNSISQSPPKGGPNSFSYVALAGALRTKTEKDAESGKIHSPVLVQGRYITKMKHRSPGEDSVWGIASYFEEGLRAEGLGWGEFARPAVMKAFSQARREGFTPAQLRRMVDYFLRSPELVRAASTPAWRTFVGKMPQIAASLEIGPRFSGASPGVEPELERPERPTSQQDMEAERKRLYAEMASAL